MNELQVLIISGISVAFIGGLSAFLWKRVNCAVQRDECKEYREDRDKKIDLLFERDKITGENIAAIKESLRWIREYLERNGSPKKYQ